MDLPNGFGVHLIISVAHLIKKKGEGADPFYRRQPPPEPVEADQNEEDHGDTYETEVILQHRLDRRKTGYKYLIKWKGYRHEDNWWMKEKDLPHSIELIEEYWQRKGGRPPIAQAGRQAEAPKGKRGRPRKNQ